MTAAGGVARVDDVDSPSSGWADRFRYGRAWLVAIALLVALSPGVGWVIQSAPVTVAVVEGDDGEPRGFEVHNRGSVVVSTGGAFHVDRLVDGRWVRTLTQGGAFLGPAGIRPEGGRVERLDGRFDLLEPGTYRVVVPAFPGAAGGGEPRDVTTTFEVGRPSGWEPPPLTEPPSFRIPSWEWGPGARLEGR